MHLPSISFVINNKSVFFRLLPTLIIGTINDREITANVYISRSFFFFLEAGLIFILEL